ncbi:hypothetical protein GWG65_26270 [Bradyrhizobium sp. CSA207]|uniref:hypothetical protein n=1 Tax=Bradyrhizobium sp. CSA207 TaxID=2698826 RepID=UPI0023AEDBC4|nr:hypothetical protein [Bradyrhizobium sp. CSA207]MDE5444890.1 hypothetical protein [Bradyrhizobium sp. CSA207]
MRTIGIAVFVIFCLAIVYVTVDLHGDHSQIKQIREECRRTHSEAAKVTECVVDSTLRHARQPQLP